MEPGGGGRRRRFQISSADDEADRHGFRRGPWLDQDERAVGQAALEGGGGGAQKETKTYEGSEGR